ncbi:hypothetical protein KC356_g359, partial [Hortaea werneckii]
MQHTICPLPLPFFQPPTPKRSTSSPAVPPSPSPSNPPPDAPPRPPFTPHCQPP